MPTSSSSQQAVTIHPGIIPRIEDDGFELYKFLSGEFHLTANEIKIFANEAKEQGMSLYEYLGSFFQKK